MSERSLLHENTFALHFPITSTPLPFSERNTCSKYEGLVDNGFYLSNTPVIKAAPPLPRTSSSVTNKEDANLKRIIDFLLNPLPNFLSAIDGAIEYTVKMGELVEREYYKFSNNLKVAQKELSKLRGVLREDIFEAMGRNIKHMTKTLQNKPKIRHEVERLLASNTVVQNLTQKVSDLAKRVMHLEKYISLKNSRLFIGIREFAEGVAKVGKTSIFAVFDLITKFIKIVMSAFDEKETFTTNEKDSFWFNVCAFFIVVLLICVGIICGVVVAIVLAVAGAVFAIIELTTGTDWLTTGVIKIGNKVMEIIFDTLKPPVF
jgi:hypothetical protein